MSAKNDAAAGLTSNEADILAHTVRTGRYVSDEADVAELARRELLYDHGPQRLAGGMHYYTMNPAGREALKAYRLTARTTPEERG